MHRVTTSPGIVLTAAQARRTAIAAQQLAGPPRADAASVVNRGHLRRLVDGIGLLQIDSVNVLARAHYLPIFSRFGPYPVDVLDGAAWPQRPAHRTLLESWAHVASLIPVETEPLLRWRQEQFAARWTADGGSFAEHAEFVDEVLRVITEQGPVSAGDVEKALEAPGKGRPGWWEWSLTKRICEYLFISGRTAVAHRRSFERRYDLRERVVPPEILALPTPDESDAKRRLIEMAARHHGIGTAADLADYYRIKTAEARTALAELVEEGTVLRVEVQGWSEPGYLHADVKLPRKVSGRALLCPFDPLIWERARTERLFDVRYRIEIYVPEPKRVYGYYVFPLLLGDRIVGRFDLKADRAAGTLLVQASWLEPGEQAGPVAEAAALELARMARWLGLDAVQVRPKGDLARSLAAAVRTARVGAAAPVT